MKKIILLLMTFSLVTCVLTAQMVTNKKVIWDYPVKPGMKEWSQFKSIDEMYQACQIPDKIVKQLDTETLVQICYDFPAYGVLFFYNSPQDGFNAFYSNFNGIRELLDRKECGSYLLKKYALMTFDDFNPLWKLEDQGRFVFKYEYFETILAQPQVIQSLSSKERILLTKETIKKFDIKHSQNNLFGGNALSVNTWIMARILSQENKLSIKSSNSPVKDLSLESGLLIESDLQSIYKQSKEYVK